MMHGRAHSEAKPVLGRGAWVTQAGSCESERGGMAGARAGVGRFVWDGCFVLHVRFGLHIVFFCFYICIYFFIYNDYNI